MATTKGAEGPSNFQSSVNFTGVSAAAGLVQATATRAVASANPLKPHRELSSTPIGPSPFFQGRRPPPPRPRRFARCDPSGLSFAPFPYKSSESITISATGKERAFSTRLSCALGLRVYNPQASYHAPTRQRGARKDEG